MIIETINLHIWPKCNLTCVYCYGTFPQRPPKLRLAEWSRIIDQLAAHKVRRVTFSGGEPTLHPDLAPLLARARTAGLQTSIITNGIQLSDEMIAHLDLVGITIDATDPGVLARLGRGERYLATAVDVAARTRRAGVALKVNTVVTTLNADADLTGILRELQPWKWKPLQFTYVPGENDATAASLCISRAQFETFVRRHRDALCETSIWIAAETDQTVRTTYVMVDPAGRVFQHSPHGHRVSRSLMEVDLADALADVGGYDRDAFLARGGAIEVRRLPVINERSAQ